MNYSKYKMKDRFYKVYYVIKDNQNDTPVLTATLETTKDYFQDVHGIDISLDVLKKFVGGMIPLPGDNANRFTVDRRISPKKK